MRASRAAWVVATGVAAGGVAAWAKNAVTTWLYEREGSAPRRQEDDARNGEFAYEVAAGKAAQLVHVELEPGQKAKVGTAIHWGLGIGSVLVYAFLRDRWPRLRAAGGLAFGVPFTWLLLDEAANPALGLSPPPQEFPWQTHARALAGHTALWLTAEGILRSLDALAPPWSGPAAIASSAPTTRRLALRA